MAPATEGEGAAGVEAAARRLEAEQDSPTAWHDYGMALALDRRTADLVVLADRAAPRFGDALIFAHNVVKDLARRRKWDAVRHLAATMPPTRREHALALYYAGCGELVGGDTLAALSWFDGFKQSVLPRYREFPLGEPAFNLIFRQGMLVESPPFVRALASSPRPALEPVSFVEPLPAAESAFVAAHVVDARYFRRFAAELCAGHQAAGLSVPLHFHVAAADAAIPSDIEALRRDWPGLRLGFSTERPGRWNHAVYYTCARFMVMEWLLDRYGVPVLTSDADILLQVPLEQVFAAAGDADFACFETGRDEPASVCQASIMVFSPSRAGRAFIADLAAFCAAKLGLPPALGWMLDQAALISVLSQRAVDDPGFRFRALDKAMGVSLVDIERNLAGSEEKLAIMSQNSAN